MKFCRPPHESTLNAVRITFKAEKHKMPILYRMMQNHAPNNSATGKYFAQVQHTGVWHTREIAKLIQSNCSLKESDVLAVLCELQYTLKQLLHNSMRVHLDGIGIFKMTVRNNPVDKPEDFDPVRDVRALKINFQPEYFHGSDGSHVADLLDGATLVKAPENSSADGKKRKNPLIMRYANIV